MNDTIVVQQWFSYYDISKALFWTIAQSSIFWYFFLVSVSDFWKWRLRKYEEMNDTIVVQRWFSYHDISKAFISFSSSFSSITPLITLLPPYFDSPKIIIHQMWKSSYSENNVKVMQCESIYSVSKHSKKNPYSKNSEFVVNSEYWVLFKLPTVNPQFVTSKGCKVIWGTSYCHVIVVPTCYYDVMDFAFVAKLRTA